MFFQRVPTRSLKVKVVLFIPTPFSASPGSILAMQQLRAKTKSIIIYFGGLGLRVRVKFCLGVRVSGMITVTVDVRVMVRVSNLLGSDCRVSLGS